MKRLLLLIAAVAMLTGCKHTEYVTIDRLRTDTLYQTKVERDSIVWRDSIFVREFAKGETIHVETTRWLTRYRDRLRTDTVYRSKVDSVMKEVVREVPAQLTRWQRFRVNFGTAAMLIALLTFCIWTWRTK